MEMSTWTQVRTQHAVISFEIFTLISDPVWDLEKVGDSTLHYVNTELEYSDAKMWCQGLGAQLVEFWTEQEYQDVSAYFSNF